MLNMANVEDYGIDYVKSLSILPNTSMEEYDERYYDDITVDFFLTKAHCKA